MYRGYPEGGERASTKCQRGDSSRPQAQERKLIALVMLQFTSPAHLMRYEQLQEKPFQLNKYINWDVLEQVNIVEKVRQLISVGTWEPFFAT